MRASAALLIGLGLAAGLGELLARVAFEPEPVGRVWDPFAWRIARPGLKATYRNWLGERVQVRMNDLGMRGPESRAPLEPGTLTLVFLGGSTTENLGLEAADTFPELVGSAVAQALGRPVRVFNAGQSGAASSTTLARLQQQALDLRPDLVIVMDGINDLLGGFHAGFRRDGRHLSRPPEAGARPRSYLWAWLRGRRLGPARRVPHVPSREFSLASFEHFEARAVFARNLRSMAAIGTAHRVPIVFLVQPSTYRDPPLPGDERRVWLRDPLIEAGMPVPDLGTLARGMRAFDDLVRQLEPGPYVSVVDLDIRLPKTEELFLDECHFTKEGNRRVAAQVAPTAIERLAATSSVHGGNGALAGDGARTPSAAAPSPSSVP